MVKLSRWAWKLYCVSSCVRGTAAWVAPLSTTVRPLLPSSYHSTALSAGGKEPSKSALQRAPRLYLDRKLSEAIVLDLDPDQAHYLAKVMRLREGDFVRAFNGRDGEWLCRLLSTSPSAPSKRGQRPRDSGTVGLSVDNLLRPQEHDSQISVILCFAPIKRTRLKVMIEKATELGVATFQPVNTEFTDLREGHVDEGLIKMQSSIIEAAEQSERLSLPAILPVQSLASWLGSQWDKDTPLYVCREREGGRPLFQVLDEDWGPGAKVAGGGSGSGKAVGFLVGPEGGFSAKELDMLGSLPFIRFVSLGPTVLRSETAAVAALGCWAGFPLDSTRSQPH